MIYFIDDDISVLRGLGIFFKSAGMEYKSYQSADDFLAIFKPSPGDVIVLDLALPGMGGCGLLENFDALGVKVPVIVVTASDDPQNITYCREYGVKAFLKKPVDSEALLDLIKYNSSV